ncbi:Uncharacterized protein GBIM_15491 [Gryllus bimaculatus]|nr:Uncharacterized protein GBIM_15491 [Gryllus bimaculatus]
MISFDIPFLILRAGDANAIRFVSTLKSFEPINGACLSKNRVVVSTKEQFLGLGHGLLVQIVLCLDTFGSEYEEVKKTLISNVKREVKKIMEEAVTRKFVHEESSSITSLCALEGKEEEEEEEKKNF